MCRSPKINNEPVKVSAPEYMRNPMLDQGRGSAETAAAMRQGRSSLRIPLGTAGGLGFNSGRGLVDSGTSGGAAHYRPGGGLGFGQPSKPPTGSGRGGSSGGGELRDPGSHPPNMIR